MKLSIKEFVDENKLKLFNNKLECICLFVINNEVAKGQYEHFLNQIKNTIDTTSVNYYFSKKLHFKIITNLDFIDTSFLAPLFSSVDVIKIDCPEEPILNSHVFFQSFDHLVQYNTTLFLGCNCYFSGDWLEKIYNYTRFAGSFWISGGFYEDDCSSQIINCSFALHATGNYSFLSFIKFCFNVFPIYMSEEHVCHDVLIKRVIQDNHKVINFISRQYIYNNLIFNYKNDISLFDVKRLYGRFCILNKNITEEFYEKEIKEIKSVPSTFDCNFYFSKYPTTKDYFLQYCMQNKIPDDIRAYHHYINYGKDLGYCISEKDYNSNIRNFNIEDIDKY